MKKYILLFSLLLTGFTTLLAGGTPLTDLVGEYSCTMPGIQASFSLEATATGFEMDYCRDFGTLECTETVVFGELVDGEILAAQGSSYQAIDGMTVEVLEVQGKTTIRVNTLDGLTLEFQQ